jgi:hypothetical protein
MEPNSITPPFSFTQDMSVPSPDRDTDIWEAPFERWMRLADDLLRQLPNNNVSQERVQALLTLT